ncbi:E3 ubiquitin-protein ligase MSL2 [Patella vulgata]|uniref:E3 ubiquitin-protein ligase MSL2 n=1 Tax=Patella vulgata TaxID=6465 RepID=UPI00217FFA46|nr:E3 ubiquitin-protein ligase MSL2 [Patella vulgata]
MTALNLYLSTCRYVMKADPNNRSSWSELYKYIPYMRQIFACCVCGKILHKPKCPSHNVCQHHVCTGCLGGKMRLKPGCSWCRDPSVFIDSTSVRIMILCFKTLCEYIYNSSIGIQLLSESSNSKASSSERTNLLSVLLEVRQFKDDYDCNDVSPAFLFPPMITPCSESSKKGRKRKQISDVASDSHSLCSSGGGDNAPSPSPPVLTRYDNDLTVKTTLDDSVSSTTDIKSDDSSSPIDVVTVSPSDDVTSNLFESGPPCLQKITERKRPKVKTYRNSNLSKNGPKKKQFSGEAPVMEMCGNKAKTEGISFDPPCKRTRTSNPIDMLKRKICKCARNNQPSPLTCLGQRCPCYSNKRACVGCMCRGCRNPRHEKDPSVFSENDLTLKDNSLSLVVGNRN